MTLPFDSARTRAILLDIEGTTTPIDFVYSTLFPFASRHVEEFLVAHIEDSETSALVEELRKLQQGDLNRDASVPTWHDGTSADRVSSAASYVRWLIARDSKFTPLKTLQGRIWEAGYRSGELLGAVYPDVAPALARWCAQGVRLAIFSSGSVLAQKLLFAHSTSGDLSGFLDGFFDTTTGPKREAQSYRRIAARLGVAAGEVLLLSDVTDELDASRASGMQTALMWRGGAPMPSAYGHPCVRSFDEILP